MAGNFPLEDQRAELARHRENTARLALAFARFETTGQGTIEFEERVDFGLTYIEEPFISYGCQIDMDNLADALGLDDGATPPLPQSTGFVTEWDIDDRGFYTGAWVAASIFDPTLQIPTDVDLVIDHHFSFQAIGLKDIPLDLTD